MPPARVQATQEEAKFEPTQQPGTVFNVWYEKYAGGDRDHKQNRRRSPFRCNPAADSGTTLADRVKGSYFCVYFARGMCYKGEKCTYLHRLPKDADIYAPSVDCFGRDKFANYRDDMGGVGSFLHENRTLFVGYIENKNSEALVRKHFKVWGPIEKIRRLEGRGIVLVTYDEEIYAQFAKEAMSHQTLTGKETLLVRWATQNTESSTTREERALKVIKRVLEQEPTKEEKTPLLSDKVKRSKLVDYSDSE